MAHGLPNPCEPKQEISIHNKNHVEKKMSKAKNRSEQIKYDEMTEWRYGFCSYMLLVFFDMLQSFTSQRGG